MIKIGIKSLTSIKRLDVPQNLGAAAVEILCLKLDEFVQTLPAKSYELTRIFSAEDFSALSKQLFELVVLLNSIYATSLADSCSVLITGFSDKSRSQLESQMQLFLAELMTLSIDIQTSSHKSESHKSESHKMESDQQKVHEMSLLFAGMTDSRKKTILAVDDMPILLKTLKNMIEGDRYTFHGLSSSDGAINYLKKHKPDLFILDIEMPIMDGYELFAKIREMGHVAPIIFLTGNATREYVMRAVRLGADGFLAKPVQKHLVIEKIKELLG